MLIDVDAFTEVNSEGGVAMGDLLLTCLAGVILTNIRVMDMAGRYQGGQFIIFLPETDQPGAVILTHRIQKQLGTIASAVAGFELTFSASLIAVPEDGSELEVVLPRLEQALAQAKSEEQRGLVYLWGKGVATGA